jgi:hypothetical protein
MDQDKSQDKNLVAPSVVKRDNSDLYRHSNVLNKVLRRERFSKAKPEEYNLFCEAAGIDGFSSPFDDVDFKIDIDNFVTRLELIDKRIFNYFLLNMRQREIAEVTGLSQPAVSNRLAKIRGMFKEFYTE